jgi:hypothetical protein
MSKTRFHFTAACSAIALCASVAGANATVYTSDGNINDFLNGTFATFSDFAAGDVGSPFTPTKSGLSMNGFRVYDGTATDPSLPTAGGNNFILATFSSPTSHIEVIPNIDHFGTAYDGYQYSIYGWNGSSFVPLYDTLTVAGAGEPFTIGTSTGTAPWLVNNVLTPSSVSNPNGDPGYEAFFSFGSAYSVYALGSSTEAINGGNVDQEFSAVLTGVPEPSTWAMMLVGFAGLGFAGFRQTRKSTRFA